MTQIKPVHVIGGGLAGSEAAWQIARFGVPVVLHEMRPVRKTDAHQGEGLAELVCSNSFRSDDPEGNAVGLLHEELRRCNSLIMQAADIAKVPAGGALAVDRDVFSAEVQKAIETHPLIELRREEVAGLPPADWDNVIVATGPLTSPPLAEAVRALTGEQSLAFFDAIAPIVHRDSIDMDKAWFQSRYDKVGPGGAGEQGEGADYINCPFEKPNYLEFHAALLAAEKTEFKEWEKNTPYFEGCLPIEVMAERGPRTLTFGPMKPVGLIDPRTGRKPYAVVQLRQDNKLGTLFNMVGFQTKMKYAEQVRVFRMIPGLENAQFARLGGIHRNTFLNSPKLLDSQLRLKAMPTLRFAGQVTGVEGYVESTAIGLLAGRMAAAQRRGGTQPAPPPTTALGALHTHITGGADAKHFQPMNVNFGLFPPVGADVPRNERKPAMSRRALRDLAAWLSDATAAAAWTDIPVTVVGATSKLAENLIRRLVGQGRKVIPLARRLDALPTELRPDARHFDLEQSGSLQTALQGAEYVVSCVHAYHGGAVVAALPPSAKRIVLMGSTRIFSRYPSPLIEKQKEAVTALASCGIPGVVLHPTMIYGGPRDANVQRIAAYIRRFGAVPLPAGGTALLQPIHTDDVVSCIESALQRDDALGEPIIVAGPQVISYRDLVKAVGRAIGKSPIVLPAPGFALQIVAALTTIVPSIPTIRIDEVRRLGEDKTFPLDGMRRRLSVEPIDIATGLTRTFAR